MEVDMVDGGFQFTFDFESNVCIYEYATGVTFFTWLTACSWTFSTTLCRVLWAALLQWGYRPQAVNTGCSFSLRPQDDGECGAVQNPQHFMYTDILNNTYPVHTMWINTQEMCPISHIWSIKSLQSRQTPLQIKGIQNCTSYMCVYSFWYQTTLFKLVSLFFFHSVTYSWTQIQKLLLLHWHPNVSSNSSLSLFTASFSLLSFTTTTQI